MGKQLIFTVTNNLNYDQRMGRICTALHGAGYDVLLVGRKTHPCPDLHTQPYLQHRLPCWFQKGKLFYLEFNIRLFVYLLFARFDLLCSIDLDTAMPGLWVCKLRGKTHVLDAHELFPHVPEVVNRPKVQAIWNGVQGHVFKHTHAVYTVGNALAAWFESQYHRPVAVICNMPLRRNPPPPHTEPSFLLYQGALNQGRGLENLLQAMPRIPYPLVLAGEGDLSHTLRQMARDLGVEHKVRFLGFVPPADLPALTEKAWLGINVSEPAGLSYTLSLNNKFFDYVQSGLPSLINPFPEYQRYLQAYEVGVITQPEVDDLVLQVNRLIQHPDIYNHLKSQCLLAAAEWHWESEKTKLIALYQQWTQT